jgi:hypothetical protein
LRLYHAGVAFRKHLPTVLVMLGIFITGVWADLAAGRHSDGLTLIGAAVALMFAWLTSEFMLGVAHKLQLTARPMPIRLPAIMVFGVLTMLVGYLSPTVLGGLVQLPRLGLSFLSTILIGAEWSVRTALLPALVCGSALGLVLALIPDKPRSE